MRNVLLFLVGQELFFVLGQGENLELRQGIFYKESLYILHSLGYYELRTYRDTDP